MNLSMEWLGKDIEYDHALELQNQKLKQVQDGDSGDYCFMLEHAPVYTIGRTRDKSSLLNPQSLPHPHIEISRGGQATYHGPGQLVGYPIVDLKKLGKDLHIYIRAIEQALIAACAHFGVNAGLSEGQTGVWINGKKLASIGVGVRKWISMHGFAINVTAESLSGFNYITPCGIQGVSMTTVSGEAGKEISAKEFAETLLPEMERVFSALEASK